MGVKMIRRMVIVRCAKCGQGLLNEDEQVEGICRSCLEVMLANSDLENPPRNKRAKRREKGASRQKFKVISK
jgi:phage FluMu protein Com